MKSAMAMSMRCPVMALVGISDVHNFICCIWGGINGLPLNLPIPGLFDEYELEELRLLMLPPLVGDNSIPTMATDLSSPQRLVSLVDSELSEIERE
jgi:hypothetical protein